MSKYWKNMEINKNKKPSSSLFISQERLAFLVNKNYYTIDTSSENELTDEKIENISNFYQKNYSIDNETNVTQLMPSDIIRYNNIDAEILTIYVKSKFVGSIISCLVPVKIITSLDTEILIECSDRFNFVKSENSIIFGATSFLVLDRKYRGKGLGMALIQESLQILYANGGLTAYFINSISRCDNSIKLFYWYFPINLERLPSSIYPQNYRHLFQIGTLNSDMKTIKVNKDNIEESFLFYDSLIKKKRFVFAPSLLYWEKWIAAFPTYLVFKNNEAIGVFSFNSNTVRYPINRITILKGYLLSCIGKQPETLQASLFTAKQFYDILEFTETGDLNASLLSSISAQKYNKYKYINFFNTTISLHSSDMYVPLF